MSFASGVQVLPPSVVLQMPPLVEPMKNVPGPRLGSRRIA
jgi:hypothetical protein